MKKILVIDDDADIREFMRAMLSQLGYEVKTAENGEDALKKLRRERCDLIFLDVMMPGMDGWATLRAIKQEKGMSAIPVIMLTVKPLTGETLRREEMQGVTDYITKPFTRKDIVETLKQVEF